MVKVVKIVRLISMTELTLKNYEPADAQGKKIMECIHRKYLWYSQNGDPTFQQALLHMSTELANPTTRTVKAAKRIVGYAENIDRLW